MDNYTFWAHITYNMGEPTDSHDYIALVAPTFKDAMQIIETNYGDDLIACNIQMTGCGDFVHINKAWKQEFIDINENW